MVFDEVASPRVVPIGGQLSILRTNVLDLRRATGSMDYFCVGIVPHLQAGLCSRLHEVDFIEIKKVSFVQQANLVEHGPAHHAGCAWLPNPPGEVDPGVGVRRPKDEKGDRRSQAGLPSETHQWVRGSGRQSNLPCRRVLLVDFQPSRPQGAHPESLSRCESRLTGSSHQDSKNRRSRKPQLGEESHARRYYCRLRIRRCGD